jgi:integrase
VTLYKRGRIWWSDFVREGIRHQTSTRTTDRRTAERIETKLKNDAALRRFEIVDFDPTLTFDSVTEAFLKTNTSPYTLYLLKHLLPIFGPLRIRDITKNRVSDYRATRKAVKPNLTESTLNKEVGVLRHILYWAQDEKLIPSNPIARIPMVRVRRTARPVLGVHEEETLLAVASPHLRMAIIAALDTGMRRGEILAQRWEHVDLNRKTLTVSRSKTPEGEGREIPLTKRLLGLLAAVQEKNGLVFTYHGAAVVDLKTTWHTAQKKARLTRRYRFHDLRHCFASRLMEAGVIADIRKALMGHETRGVHEGYTHVELPAKREAIAKLERWKVAEKTKKKSPMEA